MRVSHSADGRLGNALIASKNRQSRQKRPSGESDPRHDEPGIARAPRTRGRWRLPQWVTATVATSSRSWRCNRGSTRSCGIYLFQPPARTSKYLKANIQNELIHLICRNTRNIRNTSHHTMLCDRPDRGPNEILSTGPRVRRDATGDATG